MPAEIEVLQVAGREVTITNPQKVFFPKTGHTKLAPSTRREWVETVELHFPSGRTAEEIVVRDPAQLIWVINLGCIDLNPHPVRAEDLDHPDELRVDLDPMPGVPWSQIREVAMVTKEVLEDLGLAGWP